MVQLYASVSDTIGGIIAGNWDPKATIDNVLVMEVLLGECALYSVQHSWAPTTTFVNSVRQIFFQYWNP
jgi:hypothetical protein